MMVSIIRGLRFTHKGGEGSGHFGHAGRPGEIGGSAPSSSWIDRDTARFVQNSPGFKDLPQPAKIMTLGIAARIPKDHIIGLEEIRFVDDKEIDRQLTRLTGETGAAGFYNEQEKYIVISNNQPIGNILPHEIGHHVWSTKLNNFQQNLILSEAISGSDKWQELSLQKKLDLGLRDHSFKNSKELWADTYQCWVAARSGNPTWRSYQNRIREFLPRISWILDKTFQGE